MTFNHPLVQYIENEGFKGRPIVDVLIDVRRAGWTDEHIHAAVAALNEEHSVLRQMDSDPLHRRIRHRPTLKRILIIASITAIVVVMLGVAFKGANRVDLLGFKDPNFSMLLPEDWSSDDSYQPALSEISFYSSEDARSRTRDEAAIMNFYTDASQDEEGKKLLEGGSNYKIIRDETKKSVTVQYRLIEYVDDRYSNDDIKIHGMYVLVTRGRIKMSARITSLDKYWGKHADEAQKVLYSIVPNCSRQALSSEVGEDGVVFLCAQ